MKTMQELLKGLPMQPALPPGFSGVMGGPNHATPSTHYVPDHVQAKSASISALSNGAYNFFSQFSQQADNAFIPYYQSLNQQITQINQLEAQAQMTAAQNMPQGK